MGARVGSYQSGSVTNVCPERTPIRGRAREATNSLGPPLSKAIQRTGSTRQLPRSAMEPLTDRSLTLPRSRIHIRTRDASERIAASYRKHPGAAATYKQPHIRGRARGLGFAKPANGFEDRASAIHRRSWRSARVPARAIRFHDRPHLSAGMR